VTLQSRGEAVRNLGGLGAEIARLAPWFHNLHLPGGVETAPDHPLGDFPAFKWRQIEPYLEADLEGRRALDIGCNAGFYSFRLAARGAEVLAVDVDEHYLAQGRWAAKLIEGGHRIEFRRLSVYGLAGLEEAFDLVLFLGILYHLRHPLLALDIVRERVGGRLVLQTLTMPGEPAPEPPPDLGIDERDRLAGPGWPRAAFIERSLAGDPTNWWAPDDACVRAMLRSAGFVVKATPGHEIYLCEPAPSERDADRRARLEELRAATGT